MLSALPCVQAAVCSYETDVDSASSACRIIDADLPKDDSKISAVTLNKNDFLPPFFLPCIPLRKKVVS